MAEETSLEAWMELRDEGLGTSTEDEWRDQYENRAGMFQYAHLYYILRKV